MTYQGARAASPGSEDGRVFVISRLRLDESGHVTDVLWTSVNPKSNLDEGPAVAARVGEVVDAIHDGARVEALFATQAQPSPDRCFEVLEHDDGLETVTLPDPAALRLVATLDMPSRPVRVAPPTPTHWPDNGASRLARAAGPSSRRPVQTYAVSRVALDNAGRVTAAQWSHVDLKANARDSIERVVPVADVVAALERGDIVHALFPEVHGHLPDRLFVVVNYEDGRQTIALEGPTAYERDIHDMDRIVA